MSPRTRLAPGIYRDTIGLAAEVAIGTRPHLKRKGKRFPHGTPIRQIKQWPERTQRQVAQRSGCSQGYVSKVQTQLIPRNKLPSHRTSKNGKRMPKRISEVVIQLTGNGQLNRVTGKDGKSYPAQTGDGKDARLRRL